MGNPETISAIARSDSLSRQAYFAVRRAIRDGIVVPGQVYSELQLARQLGVSRTPVREALIELAREGAVDKLPQRGFRVRTVEQPERREVFRLRTLIESYVVGQLAKTATPDDVRRLSAILDSQENSDDLGAFLDIDEEFHLTLAELAGLERSRQILLALRPVVWLSGAAALATSERSSQVIEEHRSVVESVRTGDGAAARKAIQHHIAQTAKAAMREMLRRSA